MFKLPSSSQLQVHSRDTRLLFRLFIAICAAFTVIAYFSVGLFPQLFDQHNAGYFEANQLIRQGLAQANLSLVWEGLLKFKLGGSHPLILSVTLILSALWLSILFKITSNELTLQTISFGLAALLLGMASTNATLVSVIWHEAIRNFTEGESRIEKLFYQVVSVGFREETIKLLFFLPLVPFLYRTRNRALILFTASCIGLGFAVQENTISIYVDKISRGVTATFIHIALTGTLGYAFCRFLYTPKREWDRLLGTYLGVIFVHGLYNYLGGGGAGTAIFAIIVFAYICYYFFDLVVTHCPEKRQTISPLAIFVLGTGTHFGASLVVLATTMPSFHSTITAGMPHILGSMVLMFIYINRLRDA